MRPFNSGLNKMGNSRKKAKNPKLNKHCLKDITQYVTVESITLQAFFLVKVMEKFKKFLNLEFILLFSAFTKVFLRRVLVSF